MDTPWRIVEAHADDDWAVDALSEIQREVELDTWGNDDLWAPAHVWRAMLAGSPDNERRLYLALPPGAGERADEVAGVATTHLPLRANTTLAHVDVRVRPARRRRGAGTALLAHAESELAAAGRTTLISYVAGVPEPPPGPGALEPPTGSGRVAAGAASTRFALARGYALEQVERHSVLHVPDDLAAVAALRDGALAQAGPDYRLHVWHDEVPPRWREALAGLLARMAVDAPTGGLDYGADVWDAARLERWLAAFADRQQHATIAVAEHAPDHALAAFTVLMYPRPEVPFAFQEGTLVRADHRGHRLGMAVKATNLLAVRERRPGLLRIHTDNAEENAYMLAINVALGFTPDGVFAAWQKRA